MVDAGDNFRFALFDSNGQTKLTDDNYALAGVDGQTDNWRGYWYGVRNGTGTGSGGSIREREAAMAAGEDNPFTNSTGSPGVSRGTVGGSAVILASSINGDNTGPTYTGTMTITKTATGNDLTGSFSGTNSANANTFAVSDNTSPFPSTFDVVGFLNGNALNADQVIFQDITVTTNVPEPTVLGLAALTAAGFAMRRRS